MNSPVNEATKVDKETVTECNEGGEFGSVKTGIFNDKHKAINQLMIGDKQGNQPISAAVVSLINDSERENLNQLETNGLDADKFGWKLKTLGLWLQTPKGVERRNPKIETLLTT